ncbi:MAG: lysostaphin resistance A-like protein [Haloarculaceae archaeon]
MPDWAAFAGIAGVATLLLLAAARLSAGAVGGDPGRTRDRGPGSVPRPGRLDALPDGAGHLDAVAGTPGDGGDAGPDRVSMTTPELVANVAVTHGLFGVGVLAAAWFTGIPAGAFGWTGTPVASALALGVGIGAILSVANAGATAVTAELGHRPSSELRELLAPDSPGGWLLLLGVVLPLVAGFEELLFRGVLVGVFAAGFGLSPWPLAVVSSVTFALAHAAQGRAGVVVTGGLGFALAAAFVLTGSLLAVVVAHYLVNAVEFAVHEWLGLDVAWG